MVRLRVVNPFSGRHEMVGEVTAGLEACIGRPATSPGRTVSNLFDGDSEQESAEPLL